MFVCFLLLDDLASKANILMDPAEIQATSMDDLDEEEESGSAQVQTKVSSSTLMFLYIIHLDHIHFDLTGDLIPPYWCSQV